MNLERINLIFAVVLLGFTAVLADTPLTPTSIAEIRSQYASAKRLYLSMRPQHEALVTLRAAAPSALTATPFIYVLDCSIVAHQAALESTFDLVHSMRNEYQQ